jgi:hypothetical protein
MLGVELEFELELELELENDISMLLLKLTVIAGFIYQDISFFKNIEDIIVNPLAICITITS